jgi:hypothetical protein
MGCEIGSTDVTGCRLLYRLFREVLYESYSTIKVHKCKKKTSRKWENVDYARIAWRRRNGAPVPVLAMILAAVFQRKVAANGQDLAEGKRPGLSESNRPHLFLDSRGVGRRGLDKGRNVRFHVIR